MDISGFILYNNNNGVSHNVELWGKPMWKWVAISLDNHNLLEYNDINFLPVLQGVLRQKPQEELPPHTVVLFADTPLIQKTTIYEALTHLKESGLNSLQLLRGYIFKTDYLLQISEIPQMSTYYCGDDDFVYAVDNVKLSVVSECLRRRINEFHMQNGVRIIDPSTTYIDSEVRIAGGAVVHPNNVIRGNSVVLRCVLDIGNVIDGSIIGEDVKVRSSTLEGAEVGARTTVGPNAYLRKGSIIGEDCRIGDFVEVKNAVIGNRTKVSHLAYVGDADVGEDCNIGCGVVFVNYNGKTKSRSVVKDRVFIGSNCNLVAPIVLESGAYVGAGSTITMSVPSNALAIARERQTIKENWNKGRF